MLGPPTAEPNVTLGAATADALANDNATHSNTTATTLFILIDLYRLVHPVSVTDLGILDTHSLHYLLGLPTQPTGLAN